MASTTISLSGTRLIPPNYMVTPFFHIMDKILTNKQRITPKEIVTRGSTVKKCKKCPKYIFSFRTPEQPKPSDLHLRQYSVNCWYIQGSLGSQLAGGGIACGSIPVRSTRPRSQRLSSQPTPKGIDLFERPHVHTNPKEHHSYSYAASTERAVQCPRWSLWY